MLKLSTVLAVLVVTISVEVQSCSWFLYSIYSPFAGGQFPLLGKKDSGVDADFCYFLVERDFHTGQALRRWPHQVCEGTMEVLFGVKWRFTHKHHRSHHEQLLQIETTAFHTHHEGNITPKN